jgi:hypothetical protein
MSIYCRTEEYVQYRIRETVRFQVNKLISLVMRLTTKHWMRIQVGVILYQSASVCLPVCHVDELYSETCNTYGYHEDLGNV